MFTLPFQTQHFLKLYFYFSSTSGENFLKFKNFTYNEKNFFFFSSLYRVFGREHLIQDILRDSSGVALRLTINQRLPVILDLYQKLVEYTRTQIAISIAVEREQTCEPLIKYLQVNFCVNFLGRKFKKKFLLFLNFL